MPIGIQARRVAAGHERQPFPLPDRSDLVLHEDPRPAFHRIELRRAGGKPFQHDAPDGPLHGVPHQAGDRIDAPSRTLAGTMQLEGSGWLDLLPQTPRGSPVAGIELACAR